MLIEPGSYVDFINTVPFNGGSGILERGLLNETGRISGRAQSAAQPISPEDFDRVLSCGFDEQLPELPRIGENEKDQLFSGMAEENAPFVLNSHASE